ncbi:hypothetical protein PCE1_004004 [Barthelona sp. PCE]
MDEIEGMVGDACLEIAQKVECFETYIIQLREALDASKSKVNVRKTAPVVVECAKNDEEPPAEDDVDLNIDFGALNDLVTSVKSLTSSTGVSQSSLKHITRNLTKVRKSVRSEQKRTENARKKRSIRIAERKRQLKEAVRAKKERKSKNVAPVLEFIPDNSDIEHAILEYTQQHTSASTVTDYIPPSVFNEILSIILGDDSALPSDEAAMMAALVVELVDARKEMRDNDSYAEVLPNSCDFHSFFSLHWLVVLPDTLSEDRAALLRDVSHRLQLPNTDDVLLSPLKKQEIIDIIKWFVDEQFYVLELWLVGLCNDSRVTNVKRVERAIFDAKQSICRSNGIE